MLKLTVQSFDPRPNVLLSTEEEAQQVAKSVASSNIPVESVNLRVGQPWEYSYAYAPSFPQYRGYILDLVNAGGKVVSSLNCGLLFAALQINGSWELTSSGDLVRH